MSKISLDCSFKGGKRKPILFAFEEQKLDIHCRAENLTLPGLFPTVTFTRVRQVTTKKIFFNPLKVTTFKIFNKNTTLTFFL